MITLGRRLFTGTLFAALAAASAGAVLHAQAPSVKITDPASVVMIVNRDSNDIGFLDMHGAKMMGSQKLLCEMTLRDGRVVYDLNGLARPLWNTLPKNYQSTGDPRWDGSGGGGRRRRPPAGAAAPSSQNH